MNYILLFHTTRSSFCGGAFTTREFAEQWIAKHKLSGVLTKYPIDVGVYDWAIENHKFTPKKENQFTPDFIGGFTTAGQEHYHYSDGKCLDRE
jgi:hypothetical protein